jgi:hypothetical protein
MIEAQLNTHAFLQAEISASFMDSPTDFPSSLHSPGKVGPGSLIKFTSFRELSRGPPQSLQSRGKVKGPLV